jgi:ribose 1,5-bisphosphokinase
VIVAVVGPSGAGKDTLIAGACARRADLRAVRRVVTRAPDAAREDHEGVDLAEFERRAAAGAFALVWRAHGLSYGVPAAGLDGPGDVVFNGSRAALAEARARLPDLAVVLVIAPPDTLAARLAARGREGRAEIAERLARSDYALPDGVRAQVVMNDGDVAAGVERFLAALEAERALRRGSAE